MRSVDFISFVCVNVPHLLNNSVVLFSAMVREMVCSTTWRHWMAIVLLITRSDDPPPPPPHHRQLSFTARFELKPNKMAHFGQCRQHV